MALIRGQQITGSVASASYAQTASYALNSGTTFDTGSFVTTSSFNSFTGSYNTGSFTGSFTGSLLGTASYASNSLSASYAPSTPPFPYTGSALITGSLGVTGSISILAYTSSAANIFTVRNSVNNRNIIEVLGNETTNFNIGQYANISITKETNESPLLIGKTSGNITFALATDYDVTNVYTGALRLYNYSSLLLTTIKAVGTSYLSHASSNLVIGATTAGARLDVRAQGALSTDIALRVRNSADTANLVEQRGNGSLLFSNLTSTYVLNPRTDADGFSLSSGNGLYGTGTGFEVVSNQFHIFNSGTRSFRFSNSLVSNSWTFHNESGQLRIANGTDTVNPVISINQTNLILGGLSAGTNATKTAVIYSGVSPTTSPAAAFQLYSSASIAGNAAPHFRTEAGNVIKLYTQSPVTSSQGIADALTNLGFLTGSSTIASTNPFPYTGSAQITGSIILNNSLYTAVQVTANIGTTTIYALPTASYDGAFIDYTARSGSNARAGQLMGIWSGSAVNFTETTTTDFGSTSDITFGMSVSASSMIVSASSITAAWTVKTIIRSI